MTALLTAALAHAALAEGKNRAERERIARDLMAILLRGDRKEYRR